MQVQVTVGRAAFADALGAMREWLDRNGCPEVRFATAAAGGNAILISVEFSSTPLAAAFCRAFDPVAAAA